MKERIPTLRRWKWWIHRRCEDIVEIWGGGTGIWIRWLPIGCSPHKGSVGQGLRIKPAANGAQTVPGSRRFLSQIYVKGAEGRGREGSVAGGAGLGGGGISDQSDAIPSVLQRNSKAPASPSPPTLPRWCCFKYGSAGLNAELGDLLQNPEKGGRGQGTKGQNLKVQRLLFPNPAATGWIFFFLLFFFPSFLLFFFFMSAYLWI